MPQIWALFGCPEEDYIRYLARGRWEWRETFPAGLLQGVCVCVWGAVFLQLAHRVSPVNSDPGPAFGELKVLLEALALFSHTPCPRLPTLTPLSFFP